MNPKQLENEYRDNPNTFKQWLLDKYEKDSSNILLQAWYERLFFEKEEEISRVSLKWILTIAIVSGIVGRILYAFVSNDWISPISILIGLSFFLILYFSIGKEYNKPILYIFIGSFLLSLLYVGLVGIEMSDSAFMSFIHLFVFLWVLVGLSYVGNDWKNTRLRLNYLKLNGRVIILYGLMAIMGFFITGITFMLFSVIGQDSNLFYEFYMTTIVLIGSITLLVVAIYIVESKQDLLKDVIGYLISIFSPLFLLTLIGFILVSVYQLQNPFVNRDFLLAINIIMLSVLVFMVFSIIEVADNKYINKINTALLVIAVFMNTIALLSILFRITSYGITPNRFGILGMNIVVYIHLVLILRAFIITYKKKSDVVLLQKAITGYLPVYGLYGLIVFMLFPLLF